MQCGRRIPPADIGTLVGSILRVGGDGDVAVVPLVARAGAVATLLGVVDAVVVRVVERLTEQTHRNVQLDAARFACLWTCSRDSYIAKAYELHVAALDSSNRSIACRPLDEALRALSRNSGVAEVDALLVQCEGITIVSRVSLIERDVLRLYLTHDGDINRSRNTRAVHSLGSDGNGFASSCATRADTRHDTLAVDSSHTGVARRPFQGAVGGCLGFDGIADGHLLALVHLSYIGRERDFRSLLQTRHHLDFQCAHHTRTREHTCRSYGDNAITQAAFAQSFNLTLADRRYRSIGCRPNHIIKCSILRSQAITQLHSLAHDERQHVSTGIISIYQFLHLGRNLHLDGTRTSG